MDYDKFKGDLDKQLSDLRVETETDVKSEAFHLRGGSQFVCESRIGGESGIEFTQNDEYTEPITITVSDVRTTGKNAVVNATFRKLENFIFEGAELLAVPPDDIANTVTKKEQQEVQTMVEEIDGYAIKTSLRMKQAWRDKKRYGSALFERINGRISTKGGNSYEGPVVFKRLPAYSFDTLPSSAGDVTKFVPGELLKGIVFEIAKGDLSYWQRQGLGGEPVQIKNENIIHVRDETAESPDGESVIATLVPLVRKLNFADKCLMQSVMRAGAPNLDVIIKEYREEAAPMNADAWDMTKAFKEGKKIGQNWSASTVLTHPDCIELKPLDWSKMAIDPIKVVNFINERILYALIPRDFTENKGTAISQTGSSSLDMLNLWARGEQDEIEQVFLREWRSILATNGKVGWRVEIVWRDMTPDSGKELWDRVRIARDVGFFTADEGREIVGYPVLSASQREELASMPSKGSNPGDKLDFGDPSKSNVNAEPGAFNGPANSPNKKGAKGLPKNKK